MRDAVIGDGKLHLRKLQDGSIVVLLDVPEPRHVVLDNNEAWEALGALSSLLSYEHTGEGAQAIELVEHE